jgi:hypothetical protein
MQTEIRFLLDLVLEHKLPAEAKRLCLERIGEVEASLASRPSQSIMPIHRPAPQEQAPSTQRLLETQLSRMASPTPESIAANALNNVQSPTIQMAALTPAIPAHQRIVGGEVNTGNGTRGPRKF